MTNLSRRKMLAGTAGAIAAAGIAVSAKAASFGNPDRPPEGAVNARNRQSLTDPGKLLSLSVWRDEDAVRAWRNRPHHRATQTKGRAGVFRDYRLRVAGVLRDYGMAQRDEAPDDSRAAHSV